MKSFAAEEHARVFGVTDRAERDLARLKEVDVEVDTRVAEYRERHPTLEYSDALTAVLAADEDLKQRYEQSFVTTKAKAAQMAALDDDDLSVINAGKQLDEVAQAWLREHPSEKDDFAKAFQFAMDTHPDLAMLYRKSFRNDL